MIKRKSKSEFVNWFGPLLDALRELGFSGKPKEVSDRIAENLNLNESFLDQTLKSGTNKFHNQVAWARQYLTWEGLLDSSVRGTWKLTEKGKNTYLDKDQSREIFLKWVAINQKARINKSKSEVIDEQEENDPDSIEIKAENSLLEILQSLSPSGF
ncbi:winged helix-turn-helix domain-containing protein [Belliella baltica]|uniref:winged helix-turn-helix domain-containing protein n=1 Tax=Belliella baltica TaxID=232259 RepID=UPI000301B8FD|nr:winged helix-turn-helix domain-containing protein [Belliella baltica]